MWPSARGTPLTPSNLRRILRRQSELAGIRQVTFHTLRHSAATLLLAQGVLSPVILDVLGHQDLRMLRRYQQVTDSLRQDAADAIDRSFPVRLPVNPGGGQRSFDPDATLVSRQSPRHGNAMVAAPAYGAFSRYSGARVGSALPLSVDRRASVAIHRHVHLPVPRRDESSASRGTARTTERSVGGDEEAPHQG